MEKIKVAIDLLSSALAEDDDNRIPARSSSSSSSRSSSSSSNSVANSSSLASASASTSANTVASTSANTVASTSANTVASTSANTMASTSSSTSSSSVSNLSTRNRAISACGQALDALTHLKQMRLAEQKANFQPYHSNINKRGKRSNTSELSEISMKMTKKSTSWSHKFVCLTSTTAVRVPISSEKCLLASAGLGEKVIKFPSMQVVLDEFQDIIKRNYPQLEGAGGFDLLRCKPNSRDLEEFPYMVMFPLPRIQHHVPSGRVYIRPLQNDLKLDDDDEVDWMTECCHKCQKEIPIVELRNHLKNCSRREKEEIIIEDEPTLMHSAEHEDDTVHWNSWMNDDCMVYDDCTVCDDVTDMTTNVNDPAEHLNPGPGNTVLENASSSEMQLEKKENLIDLLSRVREKSVSDDYYILEVRRDLILHDLIKSVQRRSFSVTKKMKVSFVGEPGEDGGGPQRELWTLFGVHLRDKLCHGVEGNLMFIHDSKGIMERKFMYLGQLVATSVIQAKATYPFLSKAIFQYICGKRIDEIDYTVVDVANVEIRAIIEKIQTTDSEEVLREMLFDAAEILAQAGYTKPLNLVTLETKGHVARALMIHFGLLSVKAEVDQFKEGLLKGLLLVEIQQNCDLFLPVFTSAGEKPLTAEILLALFATKHFSDRNTSEYKREESTYMMFRDMIDDFEADPSTVTLQEVLSFFTGSIRIPIGGFDCDATLCFSPQAYYPSASTCALQLILPTQFYNDEASFREKCSFAFKHPCGFGMC